MAPSLLSCPQPFTVLTTQMGVPVRVADMTWDQSDSFLLLATCCVGQFGGGPAVLSFSGSALTETVYPAGVGVLYIHRVGSFVYAMQGCSTFTCQGPTGVAGFNFQNGLLIPLPGSPYRMGIIVTWWSTRTGCPTADVWQVPLNH